MKKKSSPKKEREKAVLLGLIELYLQDGLPVGSNTLKEKGFDDLSSATIRNYFAKLESSGYLTQLHSSGGRVPTAKGIKLYAQHHHLSDSLTEAEKTLLKSQLKEDEEIVLTLQKSIETLSNLTQTALMITSPRFDQDQIQAIKLIDIDESRLLAVVVTQFGLIHTEPLFVQKRVSQLQLRRLEAYFQAHLSQTAFALSEEDETLAHYIYHELLLRHIASYSNFTSSDVYKTGFSKLLNYPEMHETSALAGSLSLFENPSIINELLAPSAHSQDLIYYIGEEDLSSYIPSPACAVIAAPYSIHGKVAGSVALLGPVRLNYPKQFAYLRYFTQILSKTLTKTTTHFNITFREPKTGAVELQQERQSVLGQTKEFLLEDKRYPHE